MDERTKLWIVIAVLTTLLLCGNLAGMEAAL